MTSANTYTLHEEMTDSSLCDAFTTYANKRTALRVARYVAKTGCGPDVERIVVCVRGEYSIAEFPCERKAA